MCQIRLFRFFNPIFNLQAWVLPSITSDLPRRSLHPGVKDRFSHLALTNPTIDVAVPMDLLLDTDLFPAIMDGRQTTVHDFLPKAFSSNFGCIFIGLVSQFDIVSSHSSLVSLTTSIESLMDRFWHVEEPVAAPLHVTHDDQYKFIYQSKCARSGFGRFTGHSPFLPLI